MTVKEYLGQAYLLDKRIKSDSMELDELRLMAETISKEWSFRLQRISDDFEVSIHPQYDMAKNRRYALCR